MISQSDLVHNSFKYYFRFKSEMSVLLSLLRFMRNAHTSVEGPTEPLHRNAERRFRWNQKLLWVTYMFVSRLPQSLKRSHFNLHFKVSDHYVGPIRRWVDERSSSWGSHHYKSSSFEVSNLKSTSADTLRNFELSFLKNTSADTRAVEFPSSVHPQWVSLPDRFCISECSFEYLILKNIKGNTMVWISLRWRDVGIRHLQCPWPPESAIIIATMTYSRLRTPMSIGVNYMADGQMKFVTTGITRDELLDYFMECEKPMASMWCSLLGPKSTTCFHWTMMRSTHQGRLVGDPRDCQERRFISRRSNRLITMIICAKIYKT